jgi:hypothetical protein
MWGHYMDDLEVVWAYARLYIVKRRRCEDCDELCFFYISVNTRQVKGIKIDIVVPVMSTHIY